MTVTDPTTTGDPNGANDAPGTNANLPPSVQAQSLAPFNPNNVTGQTNEVQAPAIVNSAYEYGNFEKENVVLGAWMGHLLGFSAKASNAKMTAAAVMQRYGEMSQSAQSVLLTYLWSAGFYLDTSGQVPQTAPDINASDPLNQTAMSNMLATTYNKNVNAKAGGSTASSVTASLIASGAGQQELQSQTISPVTGGGGTYQVSPTNKTDLYNALYTTFYNNLGQAPTQGQLNAFVNTYQGEQDKYQQAVNAQNEQSRYNVFLQAEQARNDQMAYNRTPRVAGGAVPTGPFHTPSAWAAAFTAYLSQALGVPNTASNVAYITSLIHRLGGGSAAMATNNPLGVTLPAPGKVSVEASPGPNTPAKYASSALGMQFSLNALSTLPGVLSLLQSGDASNPSVQKQWSGSALNPVADVQKFSGGKVTGPITPTAGETAAAQHAFTVIQRQPQSQAQAGQGTIQATTQQTALGGNSPPPLTNPATSGQRETPAQAQAMAQVAQPTRETPADAQARAQAATGSPSPGQLGAINAAGGVAGAYPGGQMQPQQQQPTGWAPMQGQTNAQAVQQAQQDIQGQVNAQGGVAGQYQGPPPPPTPGPPAAGTSGNRETISDALANAKAATAAGVTQPKGPATAATGGAITTTGSPTADEPSMQEARAKAMGLGGTTLATTPAADLTGQQNQYSAADTYIPSTTLTGEAPPTDPGAAAFTYATTGANAVPYEVQTYLDDFDVIASMISNGGPVSS